MPVFFITADHVQDDTVRIEGPLLHHLRSSLRCQVGEEVWLGDEAKQRYRVQIVDINRRVLSGRILQRQRMPSPTSPTLTIGQALLKGERMDWVIQKASELGGSSRAPAATLAAHRARGGTAGRTMGGAGGAHDVRSHRVLCRAARPHGRLDPD